ncbi:helix-turn-helix domain-containing protein [Mesorhizobium sp. NBSH29]|uniref:helix-turn-helix domain-containing protein n=1 Tax=Mesorhizobium sp. NBSH29 TaxID=2654249 RepID=UPI0027E4B3B0|nr:AraC family transcriptional regulator [Mesorhizobium sp. NBSH29]
MNFSPAGARDFFGLPMHALADSMVPLDDLFGQQTIRLREQLANEPDWQIRFDLVENFITARLSVSDQSETPAQWAYARLTETYGRVRIGTLAEEIGWSRRLMVEKFRDEIGLSPKTVARIARFGKARELAGRGGRWAEIAADCGYADQAHLVREFGELAGETPGAWAHRMTATASVAT